MCLLKVETSFLNCLIQLHLTVQIKCWASVELCKVP